MLKIRNFFTFLTAVVVNVLAVLSLVLVFANCSVASEGASKASYWNASLPAEQRVELLLAVMTLEEKVGQMSQFVGEAQGEIASADTALTYTNALGERADWVRQGKIGSFLKVASFAEANILQQLAAESRLKIPLLIATDALHGHGMYTGAPTIYTSQIGLAASFDPNLAQRIAHYTAIEMRASGYHWAFSPNIEVVRDARWGRFGETFGEDPLLVTAMGNAMIRGYQGSDFSDADNVLASAKHFVAGGIAYNGVNGAPAEVSERTLHEIFFPPFKGAIENNVFTIMPAHNDLNGIPCHAHGEYLTGLIREQWGFDGFFISDWMDIARLASAHHLAANAKEATYLAVNAGMDMNMHGPDFYNDLLALVREGRLDESRLDASVKKILYAKFQLGLFENTLVQESDVNQALRSPTHLQAALESAQKSIVLLKNSDQILPLKKHSSASNGAAKKAKIRLLVTGPSANNQAILGEWARFQSDDDIVTPLEGVNAYVSDSVAVEFVETPGYKDYSKSVLTQVKKRAKKADVVIVFVGENSLRFDPNKTSGENLDRPTLDLVGDQLTLLQTIKDTGTPIVAVLINGGPVASEWLSENASAILEAWEPGILGGEAIAQALFGDYNPSGKLPITIPRSVGHVQSFYNHKPSAFHRGGFYQTSRKPLYEFGFGLSYTQFDYSALKLPKRFAGSDDVTVSLNVKNSGRYAGDETVMLYLSDTVSSVTTPVRKLVAFKRVHLLPGETKQVNFELSNTDFSLLNKSMQPVVEPGEFTLTVGADNLSGTIEYQASAIAL